MQVSVRILVALALQAAAPALAADYQAAKDLYDQGEIAKAKRAFSEVLDDSATS